MGVLDSPKNTSHPLPIKAIEGFSVLILVRF
jgi:hypothetical protein